MRKNRYNRVKDARGESVVGLGYRGRGMLFFMRGRDGVWFYDRYSDPLQLEVRPYKYRATKVEEVSQMSRLLATMT
jgi:hypothetical protein